MDGLSDNSTLELVSGQLGRLTTRVSDSSTPGGSGVAVTFGFKEASAARNNARVDQFFRLVNTIESMRQLPEDHPLYVEGAVAQKTIDIVNLLRQITSIDAPKVFPHEAEQLVLKWRDQSSDRFLSIFEQEVEIAIDSPDGETSETASFGAAWQHRIPELLRAIKAEFESQSATTSSADA
jgi:hypothetical protein